MPDDTYSSTLEARIQAIEEKLGLNQPDDGDDSADTHNTEGES